MSKAKPKPPTGTPKLTHAPRGLDALSALRESLPTGPASPSAAQTADAASPSAPDPIRSATKLVVRRERKGHGGKVATRIEGLVGAEVELDAIADDLKRSLGCGARREDRHVLLQGDQVERVRALLEARGARKIVIGS